MIYVSELAAVASARAVGLLVGLSLVKNSSTVFSLSVEGVVVVRTAVVMAMVTLDMIVASGRGESYLLRVQSLAFQYKVNSYARLMRGWL